MTPYLLAEPHRRTSNTETINHVYDHDAPGDRARDRTHASNAPTARTLLDSYIAIQATRRRQGYDSPGMPDRPRSRTPQCR
jgi:hypothetical protein